MYIIEGLDNLNRQFPNPAVTIGNFDGVHLGHRELLTRTIGWAERLKGTAMALTFHPHPVRVLSSTGGPPLLTVKRRKEELLSELGLEVLVNIQFTRQFAALGARDFIEKIIVRKIGASALILGFDSRLGRGREGDVDHVAALARELGLEVEVVEAVLIDGERVSSTRARKLIQAGQVAEAARLLGRNYQVMGTVVPGHNRGGKVLGFPTANLRLDNEVTPAKGVYAVRVLLGDGRQIKGVTNVGYNPTFGDGEMSVETFLLDFEGDLYGQFIRLEFVDRLRDEMKFSGPDELAGQIALDVSRAREILR